MCRYYYNLYYLLSTFGKLCVLSRVEEWKETKRKPKILRQYRVIVHATITLNVVIYVVYRSMFGVPLLCSSSCYRSSPSQVGITINISHTLVKCVEKPLALTQRKNYCVREWQNEGERERERGRGEQRYRDRVFIDCYMHNSMAFDLISFISQIRI